MVRTVAEGTEQAKFLREYLLGQAPRQARESFEAKYLADDDIFEDLVAAENDLIDSFVRGALSPAERAQFRTHFLSTPERLERVAFARSLVDYVASESGSRSGFFHARGWAIAAAVLIVIALAALGWNLELRRQLREASIRQQELHQRVLALTARVDSAPWQAPRPGQTLVAATFSANITRGAGRGNVLSLPAGVSDAFVILSRKPGNYSTYSVRAENADGREIWSGVNLAFSNSHEATVITVKLPSALMRAGDYVFRLAGATQDGKVEDLDEYSFRVLLR